MKIKVINVDPLPYQLVELPGNPGHYVLSPF